MSLKNVRRVTFSLPKSTIKKLELAIAHSKRSKFVAEAIEKYLSVQADISFDDVKNYWKRLSQKIPQKTGKTLVELLQEDRQSH